MLTELPNTMLQYFDTNLNKCPHLTQDEFTTLDMMEQFEESLHVIASMTSSGKQRELSYGGDRYDFCLLRVGGVPPGVKKMTPVEDTAGKEGETWSNVTCKQIDTNGVNQGTYQGQRSRGHANHH